MSAGKYDFTIEQGATFSLQVTWKDSTGTPINLTGYTISGKLKRKSLILQSLASFTCTPANQGTSPGVFTYFIKRNYKLHFQYLKASQVIKKKFTCVYDIQAQTGSTVYRLLEGVIVLVLG